MLSSFFQKKLSFFLCIFTVYILINGLIQCICSIIESSFFIVFFIEWICAQQSIDSKVELTSWIITIPDHLKTQEMCNEAVRINSLSLAYVPNHFKTQGTCNEVVHNKPCMMLFVPDHLITQEMCNEIVRTMPNALQHIPDQFKTQEMCIKAAGVDPSF